MLRPHAPKKNKSHSARKTRALRQASRTGTGGVWYGFFLSPFIPSATSPAGVKNERRAWPRIFSCRITMLISTQITNNNKSPGNLAKGQGKSNMRDPSHLLWQSEKWITLLKRSYFVRRFHSLRESSYNADLAKVRAAKTRKEPFFIYAIIRWLAKLGRLMFVF